MVVVPVWRRVAPSIVQDELARQRGDFADAHFTMAAELEDSFNYVEPPQWAPPIRRALGAALLKAGRPAEAERVYMEDSLRFPENGWSLHGLASSLRAQGKTDAAGAADDRVVRTWRGADVVLRGRGFERKAYVDLIESIWILNRKSAPSHPRRISVAKSRPQPELPPSSPVFPI
ncbi:MAG: tetratricopeptide repeat protein [Pirellulales bacterium]